MNKIFGYLRETEEKAIKAGIDADTNLVRTGLDTYLKVIFPDVNDWEHDKSFDKSLAELSRKRPDYKSESLKMIVEFDGLPHYTSPIQIKKDKERIDLYEKYGYKVIRIPYFIQLTNDAVYQLFNRKVDIKLFDENITSLTIHSEATPAFLPLCGIKRMAEDFSKFPKQYRVNLDYLKSLREEYNYRNVIESIEE